MQNYIGKPQTIKKVNLDVVLRVITMNPNISQPEISAKTGLSLQTVNKAVRELERTQTVICTGSSDFTGGRRAKVYKVNLDREYIACVYIQGETFYGEVTNLGEEVLRNFSRNKEHDKKWTESLISFLKELIGTYTVDIIGIAVPGTVTKDVIYNIPAIPEWEGINLNNIVAQHYKCRILIENDMKSAAIWAYMGSTVAVRSSNMAYISLLDHIGSAFITNGILMESSNHFSGEISYMALNGQGKTEDQTGCSDQWLRRALNKGCKEELIQLVSRIMVNICCVIAPDLIVLETPHLKKGDIESIRTEIKRYIQEEYIPSLVICQTVPENNLSGIISVCRHKLEATVQVVKL